MCTLVPMRSVPHRVVCLLGLDDGAFPRQPAIDGDDILLRDPMTGERDERSEDRQLLLDAVLAAQERLVITYAGADERTNALRPPAVPVGELLDTLDAAFRSSDERPLRRSCSPAIRCSRSTRRTSLAGGLGVPEPFSFDPAALGGARAWWLRATRPAPSCGGAAAAPRAGSGDSTAFADVLRSSRRAASCASGSGVTLPRDEEETTDRLPSSSTALDRWRLGQRMLDARLSGSTQHTAARWSGAAGRCRRAGSAHACSTMSPPRSRDRRRGPVAGVRMSRAVLDLSVDLPGGAPAHRHGRRRLRRHPRPQQLRKGQSQAAFSHLADCCCCSRRRARRGIRAVSAWAAGVIVPVGPLDPARRLPMARATWSACTSWACASRCRSP